MFAMTCCSERKMSVFKHKRKVFLCVCMSLIMIICAAVPVSAGSNNRILTGYSKYYGNRFAKVNSGLYTYNLHKNLNKGTIVYTGTFLTDVMWHKYGRAALTVSGSKSNSFSFNATKSWNNTIGANIGIDKLVSVSAEKGNGTALGWGVTATRARQCSLDEKGIKYAATGHYALAAGKPNYKIHWFKYNRLTDKLVSQGAFYMPSGQMTVFIVRSLNHQETWAIY